MRSFGTNMERYIKYINLLQKLNKSDHGSFKYRNNIKKRQYYSIFTAQKVRSWIPQI